MSLRPYLISYDVTSPRRLVRLHRGLKRLALPIQFSVFYAELSGAGLEATISLINRTIDPRRDDVRIYPLPRNGWACAMGKPLLPAGIDYTGLPSRFQPLAQGDCESYEDTPSATQRPSHKFRLTGKQRRQAREMEAKVQTGERRGISLL